MTYNEPAFPVPMIPCDRDGGMTEVRYQGLSLRDYFAGQAMVGLISFENGERIVKLLDGNDRDSGDQKQSAKAYFAQVSYQLADAMLAERSKGESV